MTPLQAYQFRMIERAKAVAKLGGEQNVVAIQRNQTKSKWIIYGAIALAALVVVIWIWRR